MATIDEQIREAEEHLEQLQDQKKDLITQQQQVYVEAVLPLIRGMDFHIDYYQVEGGKFRLESTVRGTPLNRMLEDLRFREVKLDSFVPGTEIRIYGYHCFYDIVCFYGPVAEIATFCREHELELDLHDIEEQVKSLQDSLDACQDALRLLEEKTNG